MKVMSFHVSDAALSGEQVFAAFPRICGPSLRYSRLLVRPTDHPFHGPPNRRRLALGRREADACNIRYTVHSCAADEAENERY